MSEKEQQFSNDVALVVAGASPAVIQALARIESAIRADERERCAKVAENWTGVWGGDVAAVVQGVADDIRDAAAIRKGGEKKQAVTIENPDEILRRLAAGDTIRYSQDGEAAWFTSDKSLVGDAIIDLREQGYLERRCDDEENHRGMSEYDTISEAGRAAINPSQPQTAPQSPSDLPQADSRGGLTSS